MPRGWPNQIFQESSRFDDILDAYLSKYEIKGKLQFNSQLYAVQAKNGTDILMEAYKVESEAILQWIDPSAENLWIWERRKDPQGLNRHERFN